VPHKFINEPSTNSNKVPWCEVLIAALLLFKGAVRYDTVILGSLAAGVPKEHSAFMF
jgi:hypothetical protein